MSGDQQLVDGPIMRGDAGAGRLTETEMRAMACTAELANLLGVVIGNDRTRPGDLAELILHVHAIQHAIMSQAAARAYPSMFRKLGEMLR